MSLYFILHLNILNEFCRRECKSPFDNTIQKLLLCQINEFCLTNFTFNVIYFK